MSGEPTRKRAGEEAEENPPRKIAPDQLVEAESYQNDVVIIVNGHEFPCNKESLSNCSNYFKSMFESSFAEKNKKEVEIGGIVTVEGFKLFLDVIGGNGILNDESVELALSLADFLESSVLEDACVEFLTKESTYSKEEQFVLGDKHNSIKLITRICSDIQDSYELHLVVPADMDSLRSNTKTIVLRKSFELHGHRKPSGPPLPQQPEVEFEAMVDEIIEQAAIVHHHGTILSDQVYLLTNHVATENADSDLSHYEGFVEEDSRIPILMNHLQNASNQIERNGIRAQIQVLARKKWHSALELALNNPGPRDGLEGLINIINNYSDFSMLPYCINRDKRTENIAIQSHPNGEKTIDVLYRDATREFEEEGLPEQESPIDPSWLNIFKDARILPVRFNRQQINVQVPDGLRQIPREINFGLMEDFVTTIREIFYGVRSLTLRNQEQNQPEQPDAEPEAEHRHGEEEPIQDGVIQDGQE